MIKFDQLKKNRINNRGQGLAELAVFGSLLLVVFGFLVRYGLQYNYKQEVKMEAFRRSLKMAYDSDTPKDQSVILVKDVHIPNPQDMFTQGDRQSVKAPASVYWSNVSSQKLDYSDTEQSPSTKYIYNPDHNFAESGSTYTLAPGKPSDEDVIVKEFTTSALTPPQPGSVVVATPLTLKGVYTPITIASLAQAHVYEQEEGAAKEVMILMRDPSFCEKQYCPKDLLEKVQFSRTVPLYLDYYPVNTVTGDAGSPPATIDFVDSEAGEINTTLAIRQTENTVNDKHNQLVLTENSAVRNSTDILDETENVTHVIMTRDGDKSPTFVFKNEVSNLWTTPK